ATAPVAAFDVPSVSCPDTEVGKTNTCPTIITLKNSGTASLHVTSIAANAPFSVAATTCATPPTDLVTGASCTITVQFAPTTSGTLTGFLTVADNAANSPQTVPLSGNGVRLPKVTLSGAVSCPDTVVGATSACPTLETVANDPAASGDLVISQITISSEFTVDGPRSTCTSRLTPGSTCMLAFNFTPATDGQRTGTVTLADNASDSPQSASLSGKGLGTAKISFSATSVACPDTLVGATASCPPPVTVTNSGSAALTLSQIAFSGDFALDTSTCGSSVAPGTTCTLAVKFTPTATGARTGTIQITDNAQGSPQSVTLSGNGTQPAITITPAAIACPATVVNATAHCTTTISNPGSADLTMTAAITAGGTDYTIDTSGCGSSATVAKGGGTCILSVAFKPSVAGARPGTVTLTDNAPGSPQAVTITGTGTQAVATLSPAAVTCSDTQNGTTGTCQQVTVQNTGSSNLTITQLVTTDVFGTDAAHTTCALNTPVAAGASCTIAITFSPTTTNTGSRTGTLTLTDNATPTTQVVNLSGKGIAAAPVLTASSSSVACPATTVGQTGTCPSVTLTNNGATTVTINSVTVAGDTTAGDFRIGSNTCGATLAAGANCSLTVSFTPTATGTRNGTATISFTGAAGTQTVLVAYRGTGQ
ncbi:MAG: choice-of-anchor D domain-containing protein, partial [Thermomicrobia bacterium]|nr:choice-of-anchor D domain-containing protein [Thermomicrobia bacterium]